MYVYMYMYMHRVYVNMYKDRFIIKDNTIWVLIFSPSINYLGHAFNVYSKHK